MSHTPGPWTLTEPSVIGLADVLFGSARLRNDGCATIIASDGKYDEARANAYLIAAAPELLDALKSFCGDMESLGGSPALGLRTAYDHALTVIAKAEGR